MASSSSSPPGGTPAPGPPTTPPGGTPPPPPTVRVRGENLAVVSVSDFSAAPWNSDWAQVKAAVEREAAAAAASSSSQAQGGVRLELLDPKVSELGSLTRGY